MVANPVSASSVSCVVLFIFGLLLSSGSGINESMNIYPPKTLLLLYAMSTSVRVKRASVVGDICFASIFLLNKKYIYLYIYMNANKKLKI